LIHTTVGEYQRQEPTKEATTYSLSRPINESEELHNYWYWPISDPFSVAFEVPH
jgi:hypothetical protein